MMLGESVRRLGGEGNVEQDPEPSYIGSLS